MGACGQPTARGGVRRLYCDEAMMWAKKGKLTSRPLSTVIPISIRRGTHGEEAVGKGRPGDAGKVLVEERELRGESADDGDVLWGEAVHDDRPVLARSRVCHRGAESYVLGLVASARAVCLCAWHGPSTHTTRRSRS